MYIDVDLNKLKELPGRMDEDIRMTRQTAAELEEICADLRAGGPGPMMELAGELAASLEELEYLLTRKEKLKYALDRVLSIYTRSEDRVLELDRAKGREGDGAAGMLDLEETAGMIKKHDIVFSERGQEG